MSCDYNELVKETVRFLKQEGKINLATPPLPLTAKNELPRPLIKPAPIPPPCPIPEPSPPPLPKEETNPLFEKIQKHLPYIKLIKQIPQMEEVAIVYTEESALPFLKKLAKAIEQRFYPVSVVSDELKGVYVLVITQKELKNTHIGKQILLEPIATYENNTEEKKRLWSTICHRLSQKSS